jgi:hypothetical protein
MDLSTPEDPVGATISVDVEALHTVADAIASISVPAPLAAVPAAATGDEGVADALEDFLAQYQRVCADLAADDTAAAQHIHNSAALYAGIEAALVRSMARDSSDSAPQPTCPHD